MIKVLIIHVKYLNVNAAESYKAECIWCCSGVRVLLLSYRSFKTMSRKLWGSAQKTFVIAFSLSLVQSENGGEMKYRFKMSKNSNSTWTTWKESPNAMFACLQLNFPRNKKATTISSRDSFCSLCITDYLCVYVNVQEDIVQCRVQWSSRVHLVLFWSESVVVVLSMLFTVHELFVSLSVVFDCFQDLLTIGEDEIRPSLPQRANNEINETNLRQNDK